MLLNTLLAVLLLIAIAVALPRLLGVSHPWDAAAAVVRAAFQLALLSLVLGAAIGSIGWVLAGVGVMFLVATVTATRRIGWSPERFMWVCLGMGAGAGTAIGIIFATGALDFTPSYMLALGGIMIGNAMSLTVLTGRHLARATRDRWAEIEGYLALGGTNRQATMPIVRYALREALIPSVDQTKTTGLVVLPGAFVGAIFGGASPLEAGRFQLLVLAGILAAGVISGTIVAAALAPKLYAAPDEQQARKVTR